MLRETERQRDREKEEKSGRGEREGRKRRKREKGEKIDDNVTRDSNGRCTVQQVYVPSGRK